MWETTSKFTDNREINIEKYSDEYDIITTFHNIFNLICDIITSQTSN